MAKILSFSEYKIEQAVWLQKEMVRYFSRLESYEQFFVGKYMAYLEICGQKEKEFYRDIKSVYNKLNPDTINFDEKTRKNYIELIDNTLKKKKKFYEFWK